MTPARALDRSSRPSSPVKRNALFPFATTARCHPLTALVLVAAFRGVSAAESASTHPRIFQIARPTADHSSLEVVEEGLRRLEAVSEPISIVAVVGGFHSGKSFLCNVLNRSTSGFELGPTHEATTMGLWLGETAERSASDGSRVFLLDTEGFSAPGVAESYDAQVFAVAALLSSHLVYNSVKLITAAEVEYLETLARRAKLWSLQPDFRGDARSAFPPLTWVVEDFTAEMRFVTPTEWLLSFLGEGDAIEGGRVARRPLVDGNYTMTRLFERVRAATLFLPASTREDLARLHRVPFDRLDPDFLAQADALRTDLLTNTAPKRAEGMTGVGASALTRVLVTSAQKGQFPSLPSLWSSWETQLLARARDAAIERHALASEKALRGVFSDEDASHRPLSPDAFAARLASARAEAESLFRENLFELRQLWREPLAELRRELADRETKDVALNAADVERELGDAAEDAAARVTRAVAEIPLPAPQSELARLAAGIVAEAKNALKARVSTYAASAPALHSRAMRRFQSACDAAVAAAKLESARVEASVFAAAAASSERRYDLETSAAFIRRSKEHPKSAAVLPVSAADLRDVHAEARAVALAAFDEALDRPEPPSDSTVESSSHPRATTTWMRDTSESAARRAHVEKRLDARGAEWTARNERAAAERCEAAREAAVSAAASEAYVLPDLDAKVRTDAEAVAKRQMKRFLARTARLADTDARAAALVELDRNLADHVASALERNVRRWHEALAPVGAAALARLALDLGCGAVAAEARDAPRKSLGLELAGWIHVTKVCAREYLPWAFDRVAEDAWLREFESRRDALSARLKNRHRAREMTPADARGVARVFVRTDLASYRERVVVRFVTLVISLALAVALAACVRASLRFFPSAAKPRAKPRAERRCRDSPRTTRERVAAAANKPAPWVEPRDSPRLDGDVGDETRGPNPLVFAASQPLPDADRDQEDEFVAVSSGGDSPPRGRSSEPSSKPAFSWPTLTLSTTSSSDAPRDVSSPESDPRSSPEPFVLTEDDAEEDVDPRAARVEDVERWISGARTGDDDAAERLLRFHNHPDVRRLISATKTMGLSPRALAEYYGEVLDYVRRRTGDDDIAWRDVPFVAGVLRRYADRV